MREETSQQVAYHYAMEAFIAGKLDGEHPLVHAAIGWGIMKLGVNANEAKLNVPAKAQFDEDKVKSKLKASGLSSKDILEMLVPFGLPYRASITEKLKECTQSQFDLFMASIDKPTPQEVEIL